MTFLRKLARKALGEKLVPRTMDEKCAFVQKLLSTPEGRQHFYEYVHSKGPEFEAGAVAALEKGLLDWSQALADSAKRPS